MSRRTTWVTRTAEEEATANKTSTQSNLVDLGKGHPPNSLLPHSIMAKAFQLTADAIENKQIQLSYGAARGNPATVTEIAKFITRRCRERESPVHESNLFVTGGVSHGIEIVCRVLTRPGDVCLVEEASYFLAADILTSNHLSIMTYPSDTRGIDVSRLESELRAGSLPVPRLIYIIPTHNNPTATTLAPDRRRHLVRLAKEFGFLIVADEVYHLLSWVDASSTHAPRMCHFDQACNTAIQSPGEADKGGGGGTVVSVSSFTKILSPALRLGWIEASPSIIQRLAQMGYIRSGGGIAPLISDVVHSALTTGLADSYLDTLVVRYSSKAATLVKALAGSGIEVCTIPDGGYFMWCRLPKDIDAISFLTFAKSRFDVSFLPGPACHPLGGPDATVHRCMIRVCFAHLEEEQLQQGAARIAEAVVAYKKEGPDRAAAGDNTALASAVRAAL